MQRYGSNALSILLGQRNGHLLVALLLCLTALLVLQPGYFTLDNVRVIALNQSSIGIGAVGMAFLIIAGQVDLSIGSIFMATAMLSAWLALRTSTPAAFAGGLLAGAGLGLVNGLLVWRIRVSPLIVTLGTLTIFYGTVLVLTKGVGYYVGQPSFVSVGNATPLGVPTEIWAMAIAAVAGYIVLTKTTIGRYIYAIGANRQAAEAAGINVRRFIIILFVFDGILVAVVGILTASRFSSANIEYGATFNLDVITAVILGGVAFSGGEGSIVGVILAVVFLGVVNSGLIALGIDPYYTNVIKGSALILSIALEQLSQERRERYRRDLAIAEFRTDTRSGALLQDPTHVPRTRG